MKRKGEMSAFGVMISIFLALAVAYMLISIAQRTYFPKNDPLAQATQCEVAYRGMCVASMAACGEYALQGYGCKEDKPFCCMAEQKNQCGQGSWNSCDKCEVSVLNIFVIGNARVGSSFNIKCSYSAKDVPCFQQLLKFKKVGSQAVENCIYDAGQSGEDFAVFACPQLLAGNYEFTCELTPKGAQGVPAEQTCCVSESGKSKSLTVSVS